MAARKDKPTAERPGLSPAKIILAAFSVVTTGALGGFLGDVLSKSFLESAHPNSSTIVILSFVALGVGASAYYWIVFGYGGFEAGSLQRERYDRLRKALGEGGRVGPLYERALRAALDAVDRFIGDRDFAARTLFPRAFGLRESAPLWTAQSYDRCLVIALIYPIVALILIWTMSGHVGPAETALHLGASRPAWQRLFILVDLLGMGLAFYFATLSTKLTKILLWIILALLFSLALFPLGGAVLFLIASAIYYSIIWTKRTEAGGAVTLILVVWMAIIPIVFSSVTAAALALPTFLIMVFLVGTIDRSSGRFGLVLLGLTLAIAAAALTLPALVSSYPGWRDCGPILLFCTLFTIANAPFDWFTLGLTRALLRRGLELGGWWPLVFGIVDLLMAAAVMALLSVATLWVAQLFAHTTRLGGGAAMLHVDSLLAALADPRQRTAPEYWWLYVMLFSTLIPSIVNVALGALSLVRGIPGVHVGLAQRMPVGAAVLESERMWMAPVLALQAMLSFAIGLMVMLGLIWIILEWALPLVGLNLITLLQALAATDLPGRLLGALGIG